MEDRVRIALGAAGCNLLGGDTVSAESGESRPGRSGVFARLTGARKASYAGS
jgi:hypothetical protein